MLYTVKKFRLGKQHLVWRCSDLSPNSLVEHQTLVLSIQNAKTSELYHLELLEPSFGSGNPTFLTRTQLSVLMDPSIGFATRYTGELVHLHIRALGQTFGVQKYVSTHILVQVAQKVSIGPIYMFWLSQMLVCY